MSKQKIDMPIIGVSGVAEKVRKKRVAKEEIVKQASLDEQMFELASKVSALMTSEEFNEKVPLKYQQKMLKSLQRQEMAELPAALFEVVTIMKELNK